MGLGFALAQAGNRVCGRPAGTSLSQQTCSVLARPSRRDEVRTACVGHGERSCRAAGRSRETVEQRIDKHGCSEVLGIPGLADRCLRDFCWLVYLPACGLRHRPVLA
eukprot:2524194-Heterocapsa_arctica.AAC.1